jgi:hypothetical protein
LTLLVTAALVVAACRSGPRDGAGDGAPVADGVTVSGDATAEAPLPDLEVDNVTTGQRVNLASFLPSDQALLLWFWAPH